MNEPREIIERRDELRDTSNKLIGWIEQTAEGRYEVRSHSGQLKGWYDQKDNTTRDASGKRLGLGNLVAILLMSP